MKKMEEWEDESVCCKCMLSLFVLDRCTNYCECWKLVDAFNEKECVFLHHVAMELTMSHWQKTALRHRHQCEDKGNQVFWFKTWVNPVEQEHDQR